MNALTQWIDERTGLVSAMRKPEIPASTPWWVGIWPGVILFTFFVEAVTGFILWAYYSPSAQSAWESIYYVQHEVAGGWLLRGIHYFAGQALLAVIGLYVLAMIFSKAYRAPRELVFWLAVGMAAVTIALLLTGDLLTWTQRGYWSTDVRTKFLFLLPVVGESFYKLAVGGPEMGHLTLTRFIALHAGAFTAIFAGMLCLHARFSRRADEQAPVPAGAYTSRSSQLLLTAVACLAVMGIVVLASYWPAIVGSDHAPASVEHLGAPLEAPRDPGDAYAAARPDWYFVGVYEFAHFFDGSLKIVPIFVVPGMIFGLFLLMPLIARWDIGHWFNLAATVALLVGILALTYISKKKDAEDPLHQASLAAGERDAERVKLLVQEKGIPSDGALALLWNDPKTAGPKLFQQNCVSCHDHAQRNEAGEFAGMLSSDPTAPNLHGFGKNPEFKQWLAGFLDPKQISAAPLKKEDLSASKRPVYFGGSEVLRKGGMQDFVKQVLPELIEIQGKEQFQEVIDVVAAEADRKPSEKISDEVKELMGADGFTCTDCHQFHGLSTGPTAPDLTGYGSKAWIAGIIADPAHPRFYGEGNDRMPSYGKDKILTDRQIGVLADWLRGDWFEPQPAAGAAE